MDELGYVGRVPRPGSSFVLLGRTHDPIDAWVALTSCELTSLTSERTANNTNGTVSITHHSQRFLLLEFATGAAPGRAATHHTTGGGRGGTAVAPRTRTVR